MPQVEKTIFDIEVELDLYEDIIQNYYQDFSAETYKMLAYEVCSCSLLQKCWVIGDTDRFNESIFPLEISFCQEFLSKSFEKRNANQNAKYIIQFEGIKKEK